MKQEALTLTLVAAMATTASAAISWNFGYISNTSNGTTNDTLGTGFLDSSNVLYAENFGGDALTFDGINFAAGTFSYGGVFTGFHDLEDSPLSATGTFGGNSDTSRTITIGAGQDLNVTLVDGQQYKVQLIVMDGRSGQSGREIYIDNNLTDHAVGSSGNWGETLLAVGTFTANGGSESFTTHLRNNGSDRPDGQVNAIVISQIPEPSSALLLALGGLALTTRRNRA
ncbi:PEP-CTERM sorting domain-containing protein [Roseibacillus ishigakijimensis]|uniref:PEP-CTERM sorting domain-containing protein n=1 Tax=Roseibacillus ishigakijimensis TaxID=454146 RepID=A0A934VK29_9BACT|nr:PEP-CTERM sorting domain-containing protein [Roseibacillus ishigakijimensis]MBK1833224.1 PEP-CTERM sorting domain-containing protein [Roseibacillus ishigakijimensis]